jgi:hypothetical protein
MSAPLSIFEEVEIFDYSNISVASTAHSLPLCRISCKPDTVQPNHSKFPSLGSFKCV